MQDLEGRVLLLNEKARELLGSTRVLRSNTDLNELMARVSHRIGPALAPGLFALGDAQRIQIDQRMLSVQAAAVMTVTRQHLGTVIVVRDISEEVERETARKRVIEDLSSEVQEPLTSLIQAAKQRPAQDFSREIQQHSSTLQRMILELRDLSDAKPGKQTDQQRPILLDSLVWAIANEWRQVAQAQNLTFHVMIEKPGLYVLGQERRLRWAIGNIIDNAIKYTLPGGDLTLEIQDDDSEDYAHLRVRDNGVGITREELPHVTTRFFRGRPVTPDGQAIRVPGSGQGLFTANQIIEAHGGSMEVRSKLAVGTAVYFSLPLTAEQVYELPHFSTQFEGETLPLDVDDKKSDS